MKTKIVTMGLLGFLMLAGASSAVTWPSLPSVTVQLTVVDGTTSYFKSTLGGVPAGFDVHNGVYPGWCVDRSVTMVRGVSHNVKLYSSISPPVLSSINWIAVNYILNHKQGTMMDVQNAIWHFTDNYTPSGGFSAAAQAMIDAANAHPSYDPTTGAVLAVICLPQRDPDAQNSIIELVRPRPTGKVTGGGQCIVGNNRRIPSASFGFNAMWFSRNPTPNGEINYVDHITGQHVHVHDLTYLEVWFDEPGNKPWPMMKAKFGGLDVYSGHMVDVYVEDHGEPGKDDIFHIKLNGVYLGGSLVDPILAGNIQIHKPPK